MIVDLNNLAVLGFCSGLNGFEIGAMACSLPIAGICEIDGDANGVAFLNWGRYSLGDIKKLKPNDLPDAAIYTGGFPCNGFSQIGPMTGFDHPEGMLVFEIIRLAKARRPLFMVFENVPALVNFDEGKALAAINSSLVESGYRPLDWRILNSAHYALATARKRWFAVTSRLDLKVGKLSWPNPMAPAVNLRSVLLPEHRVRDLIINPKDFIVHGPKRPRTDPYRPLQVGYFGKCYRDRMVWSPDAPAPTFMATMGGPGGPSNMFLIDGIIRQLNAIEMLAAMGFPPTFRMPFRGARAGRLIGASLCPPVAAAVLRMVVNSLTGQEGAS